MVSKKSNKIKTYVTKKKNKGIKRTKKGHNSSKEGKSIKTGTKKSNKNNIKLQYCPKGITPFLKSILPINSGKTMSKNNNKNKQLLEKSIDLHLLIENTTNQTVESHFTNIIEISQLYQKVFKGITITKVEKESISKVLKETFPSKLKILELVGEIIPKIDVRFQKIQQILKMSKILQNKELTSFFDKENRFISKLIYNLQPKDIIEIQKTYPLFNPINDPLLYSEFVSLDVQNCILNTIDYKYKIYFTYQNLMKNEDNKYQGVDISSSFEFYTGRKNDICQKEFNIKLVIARLLFFNQYLNVVKLPYFRIFFCPNEKEMPIQYEKNKGLFSPNNVNSAVTNGKDIIIWRQEELLKSIIHECIHSHKLDFHFRDYPTHLLQEFKKYNITPESEMRISEAYTEVMANFLNIIFTSTTMHLKNNTLWTIPKENFKKHFQHEIKFSLFNTSKILSFLGCQQWNDFKEKKNKYTLHQTTSVFSYYIIKSIFLFNLHNLLSNNLSNNVTSQKNKGKLIIKFNGNFNKLHQIATQDKYLSNWEQIVNYMITQLDEKVKKNSKLSQHAAMKSLRMTSIETLIPC